jgi:hypothetical protein
MELDDLMDCYDRGRLSRRGLLQALALLGLATGADAQTQSPAVPGALLNHLQLQVSNLEASRDFYTKLFGSTQRPNNGDPNRLALMVAGASLVLSKTTGRSGIGHYGVGVEPFDAKKTEAAIKRALPNSDAQKHFRRMAMLCPRPIKQVFADPSIEPGPASNQCEKWVESYAAEERDF